MNIYITQANRQNVIGGGWTFAKNLKKALSGEFNFVDNINEADLFLISGLTQTERGEVDIAQKKGIPIVFRVDGLPKPSRNKRMDIKSRLKLYSSIAEVVVYQSEWSKEYLGYYCGDGMVIYNGVDTKLFSKNGEFLPKERKVYLYVNHSSNINKRFEEAKYIFQRKAKSEDCELWLVGRFDESFNYDLIDCEKVRNFGVVENREELAKIYRSADTLIYPSFADSCPNVVLEALASGLDMIGLNGEGGTMELMRLNDISVDRMAREYATLFNFLIKEKV